ncbi:hypothetical protein Lgra_2009 [Legionella gratiana]|uniref:Uncharacterized protein n=1 Tax=Legionella gratiana TaxID=45066 RepID=A0A378J9Y7_9GAMM|nr:hypothetical protein [Legionella gratiana]KTD11043.1 hypothetical protein Lgra_2009 [Legionella gratiana]STX44613.1 Uncharacterised protein [Legionella gratiana]
MSYAKVDELFIDAFVKGFIAHLKIPYDPLKNDENSAQGMIAQDSPGDYGKISRVFDQLAYFPSITMDEFIQRRQEAGSIEQYMKPIMDQIAPYLMTDDQAKLKDEVIEAIGVANYCRLVNGKNIGKDPEINIVTNQEPLAENPTNEEIRQFQEQQEEFQKNEKDLAQRFLQAVLTCYSASLIAHNIPEQEKERKKLNEICTPLMNKIQEIDGVKGDFKVDKDIVAPSYEEITIDNYSEKAQELTEEIQHALQKEAPDRNELMNLYVKANALDQRGSQLPLIKDYTNQIRTITVEIEGISNQILKGEYSITDLKPSVSNADSGKSLQPLKDKIDSMYDLLENVHLINGKTQEKLNEIKITLSQTKEDLNLYIELEVLPANLKSEIEDTYDTALQNLNSAIKDANPGELFALKEIIESLHFAPSQEIVQENSPFKSISESIKQLNELLNEAERYLTGTPAARQVAQFKQELNQNVSYPISFYEQMGFTDDKIKGVEKKYEEATKTFLGSIANASTYEMSRLKKVINFLTFGLAYSADKARQEKCKEIKAELLTIKSQINSDNQIQQDSMRELSEQEHENRIPMLAPAK